MDGRVISTTESDTKENGMRMTFKHHHSVRKLQTALVSKRNQRERTRVRGVNDGFGKLKMCLPDIKSKSSKVETLRGAIEYIQQLKEMLGEETDNWCVGSMTREDEINYGESLVELDGCS